MLLNYENVAGYYAASWINTVLPILFYDTVSLPLPSALTPNRDSVKPKPQLCMNQNNNPQRFLLPPFPDTLCDSFSVESSTWENPLKLISSPDTPTCQGVTAGCPSTAFQWELMTVCVYHWRKMSWRTTEVVEDGWTSLNPQSDVMMLPTSW